MSVLLETSLGDLVIDLFVDQCPRTAQNFLKLCQMKYYNNCLFYDVQKDYLVQSGDPTNTGQGGTSIWGLTSTDPKLKYFEDEIRKSLKFNKRGLVAMANNGPNQNGSAFFITLTDIEIENLHKRHTIFGKVVEGLDVLEKINQAYCDTQGRPYQNIRIKHTLIIDDPTDDIPGIKVPSRSPSPVVVKKHTQLENYDFEDRLEDDVDLQDLMQGKTEEQLQQEMKEHETKTRAAVLEILEDLPDADVEPPKNVLFVCKLNPVTQEHDLELIFSRFGPVKKCEVIRDWKTGDSLQYAFIEYETEEACINAYTKMDNVLIDERRIHVDFSQSVAKLWNTHRRKQLKETADIILEREKKESERATKAYNPFVRDGKREQYRDRGRNRSRERRSRSRDRRRSKERKRSRDRKRDKKDRRRSSSSSSSDRRRHKHKR